jgi:chemotaxis protein CheX
MNVQSLITSSMRHAVLEVFSTMLSGNIEPREGSLQRDFPEGKDGVVSFIGLAGTWTGTGSITCSPAAACHICSHLLMADYPSVNEEVLDAVAELTNMIVGNVKSDLERHLGPLGLSIPTVIFGRNFKTKSARAEWIVQPFRWEGEDLVLKVALTPSEKSAVYVSQPADSCAMEL